MKWVLMLYWLSNGSPSPVDFPGYQPASFATQGECEEFRIHVDPRFVTQCVEDTAERRGQARSAGMK